MDNILVWLISATDKRQVSLLNYCNILYGQDINKIIQWVFLAMVLNTTTSKYVSLMPLDVHNGLPGIDLWFGTDKKD